MLGSLFPSCPEAARAVSCDNQYGHLPVAVAAAGPSRGRDEPGERLLAADAQHRARPERQAVRKAEGGGAGDREVSEGPGWRAGGGGRRDRPRLGSLLLQAGARVRGAEQRGADQARDPDALGGVRALAAPAQPQRGPDRPGRLLHRPGQGGRCGPGEGRAGGPGSEGSGNREAEKRQGRRLACGSLKRGWLGRDGDVSGAVLCCCRPLARKPPRRDGRGGGRQRDLKCASPTPRPRRGRGGGGVARR